MSCWSSSSAASTAHVASEMAASATSSSTARSSAASSADHPGASGPAATRVDLVVVDAGVAGEDDVLGPLVLGVPDRGDPQHEELTLAGRQRRGEQHVPVERVVRPGQRRVVRQGAQHVQALRPVAARVGERVPGFGRPQGGERRAHLGWPLGGGQRPEPRSLGGSARHRSGTLQIAERHSHRTGPEDQPPSTNGNTRVKSAPGSAAAKRSHTSAVTRPTSAGRPWASTAPR